MQSLCTNLYFETVVPVGIIIYNIFTAWYRSFQNKSTIEIEQRDPIGSLFRYLTDLSRSCDKPINECIHLTANAFIDNLCVVTRHTGIGVSHHLTYNLQRYIICECYSGCKGVSRSVESKQQSKRFRNRIRQT